jgi:hypothetical protein
MYKSFFVLLYNKSNQPVGVVQQLAVSREADLNQLIESVSFALSRPESPRKPRGLSLQPQDPDQNNEHAGDPQQRRDRSDHSTAN